MRYLSPILGITLFLLALGFAVKNSEIVTLHYYLGYRWQAPLVVIILAVFCLGAVAGIAASLGFIFRQRREISRLRHELPASNSVGTLPATNPARANDGI